MNIPNNAERQYLENRRLAYSAGRMRKFVFVNWMFFVMKLMGIEKQSQLIKKADAKGIGLSSQALSNWMRGKGLPVKKNLQMLEDVTGYGFNWITFNWNEFPNRVFREWGNRDKSISKLYEEQREAIAGFVLTCQEKGYAVKLPEAYKQIVAEWSEEYKKTMPNLLSDESDEEQGVENFGTDYDNMPMPNAVSEKKPVHEAQAEVEIKEDSMLTLGIPDDVQARLIQAEALNAQFLKEIAELKNFKVQVTSDVEAMQRHIERLEEKLEKSKQLT